MTLSINTNNGAMVALQSLNATSAELDRTQNEISTGLKVSNASDSPAIYSITAAMNGNIQGLSAVQDSLSMGAQIVSTSTAAVSSIISTLQTLQNTVTTAGQTGIDTATMKTEVANAINAVNSYARNATFNGVNLLTSLTDAVGASTTSANIVQSLNGGVISIANALGTSGDSTLSSFLNLTGTGFSAETATSTDQTVISDGQTASLALTGDVTAAAAFSAGNKFTLTNGDGTTTTFEITDGATATTSIPTATNKVVSVIVNTASSSTASGIGALAKALNDNGYSASIDTSTGALKITGQSLTAFTASDTTDWSATASASTSKDYVSSIQSAIEKMSSIAQNLGSYTNQISGLQTYSSNLSNALTSGVGALTDADMAAASAKLTSLQTKQQLAISALTVAKSSSQNILSLFR